MKPAELKKGLVDFFNDLCFYMFELNPRLPEPFFVTRLPWGGGLPPLPYFDVKPPILMILVLDDRYESLLSIHTKKVPIALHLMSQWCFNDVRVKKTWILRILDENRQVCHWECRVIFQICRDISSILHKRYSIYLNILKCQHKIFLSKTCLCYLNLQFPRNNPCVSNPKSKDAGVEKHELCYIYAMLKQHRLNSKSKGVQILKSTHEHFTIIGGKDNI